VRKTIDCLIATWCIEHDVPLLYSNRDYEPFVEHLGLQAWGRGKLGGLNLPRPF